MTSTLTQVGEVDEDALKIIVITRDTQNLTPVKQFTDVSVSEHL